MSNATNYDPYSIAVRQHCMLTIGQLLAATELVEPWQDERGAMLGLAFGLLAEHPAMASRCLGWHYRRVVRAIELRQLIFHFDRFGRTCGCAWWTRVPSALESILLKFGPDVLGAEELSGEGEAWLLDFRASFGELLNILIALRDALPADCNTITYCRSKQGRRITKRISRYDNVALLRCPSISGDVGESAWLQSDQGKWALLSAKASLETSIRTGVILELLAKSPRHAGMPLSLALGRIRHALATKQHRLLCSPAGVPLGFYSWLWRESMELGSAMPLHELGPADWRDGRDALLGDAVATHQGFSVLREELAAFAHGRWWVYPENGTKARPLMSSCKCLSSAAWHGDICDFTTPDASYAEASTC